MPYGVVALTINNNCNMQCPHCYLNYDSPDTFISKEVFGHIINQSFLRGIKRVIVVGKEPLFNKRSRNLLGDMTRSLSDMNIPLEIITNGYGLVDLDVSVATQMASIDISLDGGPRTYNSYRGAVTLGKQVDVYSQILDGVRHLNGAVPINILHTLSSTTFDVEDMMQVSAMNPQKILFSPFVMTPEVTDSHLLELSVEEMMRLISSSETFMRDARAFFILGTHSSRGKTRDELRGLTQSHGLVGKVRWIGDSSEYVRISYDGRVIDSMTALSPSSYIKMATHCLSLKSVQDFKNIV